MHHIGIDVSKSDFYASFTSGTRKFENTPGGFAAFIQALQKAHLAPADTTIGTEATGAYHLPLCSALTHAGWRVSVINPLITSRLAKSRVRHVKTGEKDAEVVRRLVAAGDGYLFLDTPEILALKALVSQREGLVPFGKGEIGEDLTVASFSPIASIALPRCANEPFR